MSRWKGRLCSLVFMLGLTGCWDRSELNELSITSATAVDLVKDKWMVSYQVVIPSSISGTGGLGGGGTSGQSPVVVHSVSSRSIREAAALSHLETPRKLYIGHNSILVLGEKVAREGIDPLIDIYLRNHESRETVSVMVTQGEGRRILEQLMNMERIPGQGVQRLLEQEQKNLSYIPNVRLYELAMDLMGKSQTALIPEITVSGNGDLTQLDELKKTSQPVKLKLGRLAVIHKNRMIGWLNQDEALGTAFLRNKVKGTAIPFSCGDGGGVRKDSTFLLTASKTSITVRPKDQSMQVHVAIKTKGMLTESDCQLDLLRPEVIRQMEAAVKKEIEGTVELAWDAVKRLDADVAGISPLIERKQPELWKSLKKKGPDWSTVDFTVTADVRLERVGLSNKTFKKLREE